MPIDRVRFPVTPSDLLAAYVLNEVAADVRDRMRSTLLTAARDGHRVIIAGHGMHHARVLRERYL